MSPDKTPAEIAVERDERGLYLSDPDLYGALVRTEDEAVHLTAEMAASPALHSAPVTGMITARFSDSLLTEVFEAGAEALTLRTVVERLGYAVTEEIDAILGANPTGPWSLEDLETMFGPREHADNKTAADCRQKFPHQVRFAEWVGRPDVEVSFLPTPSPDWSDFPILSPDFDDGDENTRL